MTFTKVGPGYSRPSTYYSSSKEISHCSNWLFFQVVKAKPLAWIQERDVKKFIWRNIICWFGLPCELIMKNGCKFASQSVASYCKELNIKLWHSTPYKPQANGQVECTNKTLINIVRKRLEGSKGKWVDKLHEVF